MSLLRTNRILSRLAYVKQALRRQASLLKLPRYIRYHPVNVRPPAGQTYQAHGEVWEDDRTAMLAAEAMGVHLKEYGFDPDAELFSGPGEPTPEEIEFVEWDDLPPPVDTR